jgi:Flp pilus assembly protein TadD
LQKQVPPERFIPAEAYVKGVEALKAKRYRQAIRTLGRVADVAPDKPAAWRGLGAAYAGEQRWNASRRAYKRALYLAPDDVISHAGLAVALLALNDPRAQEQADWLKAKAEACNDTCPEAPLLKALETSRPFAPSAD